MNYRTNPPREGVVDQVRIARAVLEILEAIGENPLREALVDTPRRVAATYAELFSGVGEDARRELAVTFAEGNEELVIVRDLPFASVCEHHLLPFVGVAHLAYIPTGRIAGVSELVRVLESLAHRPQIQERLTNQTVDIVHDVLQAKGTSAVLEAEHLCMTMRGVRAAGATVVTSAHRGTFADDPQARADFFALVGAGKRAK